MLKLPDVTLLMIETREYELARLAVEDCMKAAEFGEVLVISDDGWPVMETHGNNTVRYHTIKDPPSKVDWCRALWFEAPPQLRTSHVLQIQWDSWICDPEIWSDDFLKYDYIGAPWWYKDGKNVGNSGFSLVSTALKRYICDRRWQFPCDTSVEDDLLCRKYRPALEDAGFVWAPEWVAHNFAFECCRPSKHSRHFGFHAAFNFPEVLDRVRLKERVRAMIRSPYISRGYMMKALAEHHLTLIKDLLTEIDADEQALPVQSDLSSV